MVLDLGQLWCTPGQMPLDYSIWDLIEKRVLAKRTFEEESMDSYKKRLRLTAKRLPKPLVPKILAKMHGNIAATARSEGVHTKMD